MTSDKPPGSRGPKDGSDQDVPALDDGDSSYSSPLAGIGSGLDHKESRLPRAPSWLVGALVAGATVIALIGYVSTKFPSNSTLAPAAAPELDPTELAKRNPVRDFILTDAAGGQKKLSDFKGKVVILSFWASWCAPCLLELPTFAEIEDKFRDQGLRIVAVNMDEGDDGKTFAKDFWATRKFPFGSYFDTTKELAQQFEVDMLPSNFVIDREGRLVFSSFGANDWSSPQMTEFIESLLLESNETPAEAAQTSESSQSGSI